MSIRLAIAGALILNYVVASENTPNQMASALVGIDVHPLVFMLYVNLLLLFLGALLDATTIPGDPASFLNRLPRTRNRPGAFKSFLHKGLKRFYETGTKSGIQAKHARRLTMQLTALDTAATIEDMDIPGFKLHALKGKDRDRWSIWVNGNWRITFEFRDGHAYVLDYEDYH